MTASLTGVGQVGRVSEGPVSVLQLRTPMPRPLRRTLLLVAVTVATLPTVAEAKCIETGAHPILPGYVYVLDGRVVGTFEMADAPPHPPAEEILAIEVACKRAVNAESPDVRQAAVLVATRSGAETLLTRTLEDLTRAMEAHYATTGALASGLDALEFFDSHMTLPIDLEVQVDRWRAVARIDGAAVSCVSEGRAGQATASVRCG